MEKIVLILLFIFSGILVFNLSTKDIGELISPDVITHPVVSYPPTLVPSLTPSAILPELPTSKTIPLGNHVFQTFNNCGPAALSMALSYHDINETQAKLGQDLRPYQVTGGDNDDKSVTLEELAEKSKEFGLISYHRPSGSIHLLKNFIANDIPVITRTLTKTNEDIGHYRLIRGYDEPVLQLIQDDSLQGKNLRYSYDEFNNLWKGFNFEYLVLVPAEKRELAETILGEDLDEKNAWTKAAQNSRNALIQNPDDIYARFNLSVALYNIGEYQNSTVEFEKVENKLPFRTLWYQIEPILAYQKLKNYTKVFQITDKVLNYHNRAFSELYIIRGEIYLEQGQSDLAKAEFEKAITYNKNLKSAHDAIQKL